jgi:uncharacterized protein (TIGR03435 family)
MLRIATIVLAILCALPAFSQEQIRPSAFEVADVKVNKSGEARMAVDFLPGGKLSMRNVPMKVMVMMAYHVRPEAVTGGPGWIESDRFDVVAKASQATTPAELRRMLQTLLAERFNLALHMDQKIMPAYAMVLGRNGSKMQPADAALLTDQRCSPGEGAVGQKHVTCRHITMAVLADTLQEIAARDIDIPVVDQTGLPGAFNFKLDWTPAARAGETPTADEPAGPTLFEAVEAQLGLRLENRKLPLPVMVIDRVERVPTGN